MRSLEQEVLDVSLHSKSNSHQSYEDWKKEINKLDKQKEGLEQEISFLKQEKQLLEKKIEKLKQEEQELSKQELLEEIEMLNKIIDNASSQNKRLMSLNESQEVAITRFKTQVEAYKEGNAILKEQLRVETEERITYQKMYEAEKNNNSRLVTILSDKKHTNNNPKKEDGTEISLESEYAKTEYIFLLYSIGLLTNRDIAVFIKQGSIKMELFEEVAFKMKKSETIELVKRAMK